MDRDELAALFYGRRSSPQPWTTDCPVRFDVWWEFAQPSTSGLDRRADLILTIREDHGVADLLRQLRMNQLSHARPAAVGGFVVVSLSLRELMRVVVPLTNLEGIVRTARRTGRGSLIERARDLDGMGTTPEETRRQPVHRDADEPERSLERDEQLDWLVNLLHGVIRSCAGDTSDTAAATVDLVLSVPVHADRHQSRTNRAAAAERRRRYPVDTVTTNRPASAAVSQSRATVKADAAEQVFSVDCATIGWAVVDSGIDAAHPAFFDWDTRAEPDGKPVGLRVQRVFDFHDARRVLAERSRASVPGLVEWRQVLPFIEMSLDDVRDSMAEHSDVWRADRGRDRREQRQMADYRAPAGRHGTHVAGILGGHWPAEGLRGICPNIKLYDFRVLDGQGHGDEFSVLAAMQAIRHINELAGRLVIAGVNLSLSVPHDVAAHACGWTPVCQEAERLVRSGVVVVAAAGNAGFGELIRTTTGDGYRPTSVSDPGNADAVITVGSTHRSNPHRHGVSYFSGRGPTADGRAKPDLIAPGEDIDGPVPGGEIMAMHGTSQAAAHVSGAAAMLMARHRELIGRPERIKQILCSTATDLGRERDFQGHGLVDVLRAIQSL